MKFTIYHKNKIQDVITFSGSGSERRVKVINYLKYLGTEAEDYTYSIVMGAKKVNNISLDALLTMLKVGRQDVVGVKEEQEMIAPRRARGRPKKDSTLSRAISIRLPEGLKERALEEFPGMSFSDIIRKLLEDAC